MIIEHIPTHLIAGPLGSGKTSLLRQLMKQRPENERWAILINEFGQVGIDAALLATSASGIQLAEIPGGCLCCVNGVPFQVGLGRLLRRARPHRLFIEASGLGHPQAMLQQLAAEPWQGVLALQPMVMVMDAQRLLTDPEVNKTHQQSLAAAGLIVLNKAESLSQHECVRLTRQLPPVPSVFCSRAALSIAQLPLALAAAGPAKAIPIPDGPQPPRVLWRKAEDWHCQAQHQDNHHSIGWTIHPRQIFVLEAVRDWLRTVSWQRAKGVLHTDKGWLAFNGLDGEIACWQPSEWRQDNRLELIAAAPLDPDMLECRLRAALITPPASDPENVP